MERDDRRAAGSEGRPGGGRHHHHLREGAGGGLHHALHEPRRDYSVQEAHQEGPQPLLISLPALLRRVDLHHYGLPRRVAPPLLPLPAEPLREESEERGDLLRHGQRWAEACQVREPLPPHQH